MAKGRSSTYRDDPPPKLETRHYEWIFSAAQEHFAERIKELELDQVRHQVMFQGGSTQYQGNGIGESAIKDRTAKIIQNNQYLEQYRLIVYWLSLVRERVVEVSAEEFAKSFWENRGKK